MALALGIAGIVMTSIGAFAHVAQLNAPGAAAIFVGGAWVGNVLARRGVHLFPTRETDREERKS